MVRTISTKFAVEGEAAYKTAVANINREQKVLISDLALVSARFKGNEDSMEAVKAKTEVLNKIYAVQKDKVRELSDALQNAKDSANNFGAKHVELTDKLQANKSAMDALNKSSDYSAEAMTKLVEENKKLNKELETNDAKFDASVKSTQSWKMQLNGAEAEVIKTEAALKDVNKELVETDKVTKDSSESFEKFSATASKVGVAVAGAVVAIAAASAAAVTALAKMSAETAAYADNILTLSAQTRISTQALQEYSYAADLVDVSVETLTGSMARQIRSMSSAQEGSKLFAEAYDRLGISVADVNGNLRDSETVYWEAIDALGRISNETERDAIAMQLFGKSAQDLNPIIAQGSEGMKAFAAEAHSVGAVMSDEALKAFGEFDDALQRLTQGTEAAKRALGGVLLPQLTELATTGKDLLSEFTNGLNEAGGDMTKVGELVGDVLGNIIKALTDMMPKAIEMGTSIITSLTQALIENLPQMSATGTEILLSIADGIVDTLPELIPAAIGAITTIIENIVDNLPRILDAGLSIIEALGIGIIESLPDLVAKLPEILYKIVEFVVNAIPDIAALGVKLFSSLWENMDEIEADMKVQLKDLIEQMKDEFKKKYPSFKELGKALIENLILGMLPAISWIQTIVDVVREAFGIESGTVTSRTASGKQFGESDSSKTAKDIAAEIQDKYNNVNLSPDDKANVKETTDAIKEISDKNTLISDAITQANIDANDTTQEATNKIISKIEENTRKAEIIAAATKETELILRRNALANWDPKTQSYVEQGGGYIITSDGKVTKVGNNADGTDNWPGGLTWVGEKGPELMRLPRGTQIFSNEKSQSMVGDTNIYLSVDISKIQDVDDVIRIAKKAKQSYRMGVV